MKYVYISILDYVKKLVSNIIFEQSKHHKSGEAKLFK